MIMMNLKILIEAIDRFLGGQATFEDIRRLVYDYYEAEQEIKLDDCMENVYPILTPYLEYEEAYGDAGRETRFRRLRLVLDDSRLIGERMLFALEFERIQDLTSRFRDGKINRETYEAQIKKLSPANFDTKLIGSWASAHFDKKEIDPTIMV